MELEHLGTREEAYTSALYTALGTFPALLHFSAPVFFKFFGLACVGWMLYRLRTLAHTRFAFLLGLLLVALDPWVWIHAYAGLETPLYMLLLLEMAICVDRAQAASPVWVYTLFLLLPLTRPEGIIFACVGVVLFWIRAGEAPKRYGLFALAIFLGMAYFLLRWRYFHHFLPNPYYFKLAPLTWKEIGANFFSNLKRCRGYFLTLILILIFSAKNSTRVFVVCGLLVLSLLYAPHMLDMNYAERFYFQVVFPFVLFFLIGEGVVREARIAAGVVMITLFSITPHFVREVFGVYHYSIKMDHDLGRRLAAFTPDHTILGDDAGAIPYYSNWHEYDLWGLGTYRIARYGVSVSLLKEFHPDLMLVDSSIPSPAVLQEDLTPDIPSRIAEIEFLRQSNDYEYVAYSGSHQNYYVEFLRKDTPQHDEIVRALQEDMRDSAGEHLRIRDFLVQYVPWGY